MVDAPALGAGPFGGGGSSPLFRTVYVTNVTAPFGGVFTFTIAILPI